MASKRSEIHDSFVAKLGTIKSANGYATNVQQVYADDSPMGLDFEEFNLPAIIMVSSDDSIEMKQQCVFGNWAFELQLWHKEVSDSVMNDFVRDVYKAIFAGTASDQKNNAFKSIHPAIYNITPLPILSDLNMIEANRCYVAQFIIQYTTKLWDL